MLNAIDVLRSTIDDPWESATRVLEIHADADWGDAAANGTPLWHLWHTADCFRHHASKVIGDDQPDGAPWHGDLPLDTANHTPAALVDILRNDVNRFCTWLAQQSDERLQRTFKHGVDMNAQDMINLMIRHVMWHITRAHALLIESAR